MLQKCLILMLLCSATMASAQKHAVSGVVKGDDGSGLPGVSVLEKGTTNGIVTDLDGKYKLTVNDNSILVFTYVSYMSREIPVGKLTEVNISLSSDEKLLSEMVVVGYGSQKKSDLTGVVTSVDSKDFNRGAIISPEQLVVGKVAGVQITSNNGGEPGASSSIRIRGGTSII